MQRERIDDFVDERGRRPATRIQRWRETLPNGVSYTTLSLVGNGPYANTPVFQVPPGHYFMMGDNRDNSADSRVPGEVGYVPFENLIGRAQVIFFSVREGDHAWEVWAWPWDGALETGCSRWRGERVPVESATRLTPVQARRAQPSDTQPTHRQSGQQDHAEHAAVDHERPGRVALQHPHQGPDRHEGRRARRPGGRPRGSTSRGRRGGPCAAPTIP